MVAGMKIDETDNDDGDDGSGSSGSDSAGSSNGSGVHKRALYVSTDHAVGCGLVASNAVEAMIARHLMQDDGRGLAQGVIDRYV
jgi:hypothetical protein